MQDIYTLMHDIGTSPKYLDHGSGNRTMWSSAMVFVVPLSSTLMKVLSCQPAEYI